MFDKLLSKHMKIERMAITIGLMAACLAAVLICDGFALYKQSQVQLSNEAVITSSTVTSLTNTDFTIDGVYENEARTQAIIVMSGNLSNTSYLADKYQVFVSGESSELYSGGIYVFDELDKLCISITNAEGFKPELTQMVVRCTAPTGEKSSSANEAYAGLSNTYSQYDQMALSVNFGASEAKVAAFLNDSGIDIETMAEQVFANEEDEALREELATLQSTMVDAATTFAHVRTSISDMHIQLPTLPDYIANDSINTREETGTSYIKTEYIFDGLADFDWENTSSLDSYEEAAGVSAETLTPDSSLTEDETEDMIWYYEDNSVIENPSSAESSLMTQYTSSLDAYKSAKYAYQQAIAKLIQTQAFYVDGIQNYKSNIGADVIMSID